MGTGEKVGYAPPEPDLKKWDIGQSKRAKISFDGFKDITALNNEPVAHAEAWSEKDHLPFTKLGVNYSYFITRNGTDIITHRINFGGSKELNVSGAVLYGNFSVKHDVVAFRETFKPPPACLKNNVLSCGPPQVKKWNDKYFKYSSTL